MKCSTVSALGGSRRVSVTTVFCDWRTGVQVQSTVQNLMLRAVAASQDDDRRQRAKTMTGV